MSRGRRFTARLAATIAAALLVGVLAAGTQVASSATANPVCGPMQHVLGASGQSVPPVNAMQPVLLVHGFNETPAIWDGGNGLAAQLDASGSGFFVGRFDYSYVPGLNQHWVTDPRIAGTVKRPGALAQVIDCMARESLSAGGDGKVIVIGASMGGLALQQALAEQVGGRNIAGEVGGLVSIGTPWQGADPAFDTLTKVIEDTCDISLLDLADPPVAAAADVCVAELLKLGIGSQAGPAMLPASGGGPSAVIKSLPKMPSGIPVLAVAGNMRWTDQRLNQVQIYQGSDGVVSVTSAISPPFESGTGLGQLKMVVDPCVLTNFGGAVPIHSKEPAQPFSSHLPLCFHVTLPVDPRVAEQIVPVLQRWRGTLLAGAAKAQCSRSAMTSAVAPAMESPSMAGVKWSVGAYACEDGYALVDINVVMGLAPTAVLRQEGSSWKLVYGPTEDICLTPPDPQECPNHQLPAPLPVLNALEAAIARQPAAPASPTPSVPSPEPSTQPPWSGNLGPGVTVEPPPPAPYELSGSPQGAADDYLVNLASPNPPTACLYVVPSVQSDCQSAFAEITQQGESLSLTYSSLGIGYTAVEGYEALVGLTYSQLCVQVGGQQTCPPDNSDPAAPFESGQSFDDIWATVSNSSSAINDVIPCEEVNGTWYVDLSLT
jgi:pimeloyl-ACP methyl ester carboxylesterase